jgi:two-component system OmpR family sensor kinase
MAWMLLLMAVVLLTVTLVTRALLMQRVDADVTAALEQEASELTGVARAGVDRATRQPFHDVHELLFNHLQRQHPDDDEVIVGWVAEGESGKVLAQDRVEPFRLADRPDVLDPILRSADSNGSARTDAGEMRWIKVEVTGRTDANDRGYFVVGYFVDRDRVDVDQTIRTLVPVSGVGMVLAAIAAWLVAGQILAPVRLVRRAAAELTERDLTQRIPVQGRDDIAALTGQFNSMLDRLEQAFGTQRQFVDQPASKTRSTARPAGRTAAATSPTSASPAAACREIRPTGSSALPRRRVRRRASARATSVCARWAASCCLSS